MTIFQKMLVLPLLSLVLYSGFLLYSYNQNQQNNINIEKIRDDYLPLLELANTNINLFGEISEIFKDAVSAGENEWIYNSVELKNQVEANFAAISRYPHIVDGQSLQTLIDSFHRYYDNARELSLALVNSPDGYMNDSELLQRVERSHNQSSQRFNDMKAAIHSGFTRTVDQTHHNQQQLVMIGSGISGLLLITLASVGLITSFSIRKKLLQVNNRMKELAEGDTDFARRLEQSGDDELGTLVYWFNQLSDKLEEDHNNIEQISITDKLTGLNNRMRTDMFLDECIDNANKEGTELSVILLDIDHFKTINDRYGHLAGDKVLQAIAGILKSRVDPTDFIGRWGGEEFILVLPRKDLEIAASQAESIRNTIEISTIPGVGTITASLGVNCFISGDVRDSLIKRVDEALYAAKREGRNKVAAG